MMGPGFADTLGKLALAAFVAVAAFTAVVVVSAMYANGQEQACTPLPEIEQYIADNHANTALSVVVGERKEQLMAALEASYGKAPYKFTISHIIVIDVASFDNVLVGFLNNGCLSRQDTIIVPRMTWYFILEVAFGRRS